MNILVTGGCGFIGSNLSKRLLAKGHRVICVDNLSTSNIKNIEHIKNDTNFTFVDSDVSSINLESAKYKDIDQIYNLASPTAPGHYKKDPINTIITNSIGIIPFLDLATKENIPILHASTIRVSETDHLNPNACYTEGKRISETICSEYIKKHNTNIKIARLGNTYGPGMSIDDSRVIPQFVMKCLKNEDITILGTGNQKDTFCYISDVLIALEKFMNSDINGFLTIHSIEQTSIIDLANLVIRITKSKSKIIKNNSIKIESKDFDTEIYSTLSNLNWHQDVKLFDGIRIIADYYQNLLKIQ